MDIWARDSIWKTPIGVGVADHVVDGGVFGGSVEFKWTQHEVARTQRCIVLRPHRLSD